MERVSNFDNLEIKPHPFTEGDTLNKFTDADLSAIINHGGPRSTSLRSCRPGATLSASLTFRR